MRHAHHRVTGGRALWPLSAVCECCSGWAATGSSAAVAAGLPLAARLAACQPAMLEWANLKSVQSSFPVKPVDGRYAQRAVTRGPERRQEGHHQPPRQPPAASHGGLGGPWRRAKSGESATARPAAGTQVAGTRASAECSKDKSWTGAAQRHRTSERRDPYEYARSTGR